MLIGGGLLAIFPVVISSYFISQASVDEGTIALEQAAEKSLTAIRDITAAQIKGYIEGIENQAQSLSENLMVVGAMKDFSTSFSVYGNELSASELTQQKINLKGYYENQFGAQFRSQNGDAIPDTNALLAPLDAKSIALQHDFISNSPHPIGSKQLLDALNKPSSYNQYHQQYHGVLRAFIERFGYYDLFLVDSTSGDVVYSVFKELDFATSLVSGPYATSGIGKAFAKANAAQRPDATFVTDFSPYLPSYNGPASFIASPIFDGNTKVGILILQMPVDKINEVMTHGKKWQDTGLGLSGETYLVGADFTMRSNGRFLIEDKDSYIELMQQIGLPQQIVNVMRDKSTSIGLQPVKTIGAQKALKGETGFAIFNDYRDVPVLSAYKPINVGGLNWAILSEIDEAEAFAPVAELKARVGVLTTTVILVSALTGPLLAWFFAANLLVPIKSIISALTELSTGEGDLTKRVKVNGSDEIAEMAALVNNFIAHLDQTFSQLVKSAMRLVPMSQELAQGNSAITSAALAQNKQIIKVKDQLLVASKSTQKVSTESSNIMALSHTGAETVQEGVKVFNSTYTEIKGLGQIIDNASVSIDSLKSESDKIETVIEVINAIAEQTNLLALNAAIEAARAGEAGRGFAVVADEVRALASRTRESTLQVSSMVAAIQSRTDIVVDAMALGLSSAEKCYQQVDEANTKLSSINDAMSLITKKIDVINGALKQQELNFDQVNADFTHLDECFEMSREATNVTVQIGFDMNNMSEKLRTMVERFTLSDISTSNGSRESVRIDVEKVKRMKAGTGR